MFFAKEEVVVFGVKASKYGINLNLAKVQGTYDLGLHKNVSGVQNLRNNNFYTKKIPLFCYIS